MGNLCANPHCHPWFRLILPVTGTYPFQRERPVACGNIALKGGGASRLLAPESPSPGEITPYEILSMRLSVVEARSSA
jgi:hypothetical protein